MIMYRYTGTLLIPLNIIISSYRTDTAVTGR